MSDETIDNVLDGAFAQDKIDKLVARKAAAYQERVLKKVMTVCGLDTAIKELRAAAREKTGSWKLDVAWFNEFYPSFPVNLCIEKVPYIHDVKVVDLFNKPKHLPFVERWAYYGDLYADSSKPTALVFDWIGLKGSQIVLHNSCVSTKGTVVAFNTHYLMLEQFDIFLEHIAATWSRT